MVVGNCVRPFSNDPCDGDNQGSGEDKAGWFGYSVALSGDGKTALIGAPYVHSAWVFARSGDHWKQQGPKLIGVGGDAVALSVTGDTALIDRTVLTRSGSTWAQQAVLTPAQGLNDRNSFGRSAALSGDGDTALVGDAINNVVYVFTRTDGRWTEQAKLSAGGSDYFGQSLSLSRNGDTALIGAWATDNGDGAAYVFYRRGSTWSAPTRLRSTESGEINFGYNVALSGWGTRLLSRRRPRTAATGRHGHSRAVGSGTGSSRRAIRWTDRWLSTSTGRSGCSPLRESARYGRTSHLSPSESLAAAQHAQGHTARDMLVVAPVSLVPIMYGTRRGGAKRNSSKTTHDAPRPAQPELGRFGEKAVRWQTEGRNCDWTGV